MKKFFLLALTLLLVCNVAFASEDPKASAKATLVLDLGGKSSIAHVGFRSDAIASSSITTLTEADLNEQEIILADVDNTGKEPAKEFITDAKSFYIFWYLHSLKGDVPASVSFSFSRFAGEDEYLGYDLTISNLDVDAGTLAEVTTVTEGANPSVLKDATTPTEISIVKTNEASTGGLTRGCLMVTINPIEYDNVSAQEYTASLSLKIMAP